MNNGLRNFMLPKTNQDILKFFSTKQWIFFIFIVALSLAFRFIGLEDRPIHHDEAIHLIQGYYYFERPDSGFYKYDPMTHGPFLYHALRVAYRIFGYSVFSGRVIIAFLGSLFVLLPFLFRKYLKPTTVLFMTMLIGLSPTMIFWSRFVRHDYLMLTWWSIILIGVILANPRWKAILVILGLSLQICTKENSYVFYAVMIGYLFFEFFFMLYTGDNLRNSMLGKIYNHFISYKITYLVGLLLSIFVIYYFFSGGFRYFIESPSLTEHYFGTFLDGIYRKSIGYWLAHHGMERIKGPFLFQFYMMAWHDFLLLIIMIAHIVYLCRKAIWTMPFFIISFLTALILALVHSNIGMSNTFIWNFFKLKNSYDFFGLCILPTYAFVVTVYHLLKKERSLAFFGYFAAGNMATYCYLGEKVPWLSVYPIIAFIVYYSLLFNEILGSSFIHKLKSFSLTNMIDIIGGISAILGIIFIFQSKDAQNAQYIFKDNVDFIIFGVVLCIIASTFKHLRFNFIKFIFLAFFIYDIRMARIVNFQNAGSEFEVFSQVHTSKDLHNILNGIKNTIDTYSLGYMPIMYVKGETVWPVTTYMIGYQQLKYSMNGFKLEDFKYLIEDQESTRREKKEESLIKGREDEYYSTLIKTRCWWDPDYNKMTLKGFLNYSFNHIPWSGPGFFHAMLHIRKK